MNTYTLDQKAAMLVVPILLFGVLGASTAYAFGRNLTEEERNAIEEARDLRQQGDFEKAQKVLRSAGITRGPGFMQGPGPMHEERKALRNAIESEDYDAFTHAIEGMPFAEGMTEEIFKIIVQAHSLREEGKYEAARDLLASNDIIPAFAWGQGIGHRMKHGHGHGTHH